MKKYLQTLVNFFGYLPGAFLLTCLTLTIATILFVGITEDLPKGNYHLWGLGERRANGEVQTGGPGILAWTFLINSGYYFLLRKIVPENKTTPQS